MAVKELAGRVAVITGATGLAVELGERGIRSTMCPGVIGGEGMSQDAIDASSEPH
ncbi:MAG TPA: hypothetical protein VFK56_00875 [Mycobacterium sp.]|nr:hypothetical protein [Mycobacterium sp.]